METALQSFSTFVLALATVTFVGGTLAFLWDYAAFSARREAFWRSVHQPHWDKDGNVQPRHEHCLECEVEVEKAGGELTGHSTLE